MISTFQQLNDPATRSIPGRDFHLHSIPRTQSLKIPDARSRRMRRHDLIRFEPQPIPRAGQQIDHRGILTSDF
jgi:hypothetical protein